MTPNPISEAERAVEREAANLLDELRDLYMQATTERSHYYVGSRTLKAAALIERLLDEHAGLKARVGAMRAELQWIAGFAEMRSKDDSKVFARVFRGALRNIAERAAQARDPALIHQTEEPSNG